ncbi:MAG: hypothetical protein E6R14_01030 [Thermomicrobiales bacterium]|jgi:nitrate reductase gamma subunit|nr:MAG: hypothetical protein E6R14_01030 [Thermomicrobiales bacterium]
MNATAMDMLIWARGTGFSLAMAIALFGLTLRVFEILSLGRKHDFAPAREDSPGSGLRTILSRSIPPPGMVHKSPVTYVGGYVFHVGLLLVIVFFVPHIETIRAIIGLSWPGLPTPVIDMVTVATLLALVAVMVDRRRNKVKRMLSGIGDYFAWAITFLPVLSGYLAFHHLVLDYTLMLAIHILSVELLMVALPFTKLTHVVTLFFARWYNGDWFGRRGVAS